MSKLISEKIIDLLDELEFCDMDEIEKNNFAKIFITVAQADVRDRLFFYSETAKIAKKIRGSVEQRKKELLDELMGRKRNNIIN